MLRYARLASIFPPEIASLVLKIVNLVRSGLITALLAIMALTYRKILVQGNALSIIISMMMIIAIDAMLLA